MVTPGFNITTDGPLFSTRERNAMLAQLTADAVRDVRQEGELVLARDFLLPRPAGVYKDIPPSEGGSAGFYANKMVGKSHGPRAEIWDGGVIYGAWLEGTSERNRTTRFKGYGSYRKTATRLNKNKRRIVREAVRRGIRKLNGR